MKDNCTTLYPNDIVGQAVSEYADRHSLGFPARLTDYHAWVLETQERSWFTVSMLEARFLTWIAHLVGASRVLEVGTFVGFSVAVWADAVGPNGFVTGLERSPEYAKLARDQLKSRGWHNAQILEGDACELLNSHAPPQAYDIIFIDAQKSQYPEYLRSIVDNSKPGSTSRLLRPGGLIIGDNALRSGLVANQSKANPATKTVPQQAVNWKWSDVDRLDEFNRALHSDPRLENFLLPVFDGLGLARLLD
ncbi:hypothetical protein AK830_g7270 [Neonectria ditissima]|uniref:O-methyltransferase MdmC n=1 Tax=Neonectria ditissima TaxID=78410 RepID=A0A0P7AXI0_9HYPO|nr:hypothetical protein AK830_g7270 [Neonectria ditissima]